MSGQRKSYSEHKREMEEYLRKYNIYGPHEPCDVNLRALSNFMKENNLSNTDVTPEIVEMFRKK